MKTLRTMDLSQFFAYPALMNLVFSHNYKAPSRDSGVNEEGDIRFLALDLYQPHLVQDGSKTLLFYSIIIFSYLPELYIKKPFTLTF